MSRTDSDGKLAGTAMLVLASSAVLFHLFAAGVTPFTALIQRPVHLGLMASLGFLGLTIGRQTARRTDGGSSPLQVFRKVVRQARPNPSC